MLNAENAYLTAYKQAENAFKTASVQANDAYMGVVIPAYMTYSQTLREYETLYLTAVAHAGDVNFNVANYFAAGYQDDYLFVALNQQGGWRIPGEWTIPLTNEPFGPVYGPLPTFTYVVLREGFFSTISPDMPPDEIQQRQREFLDGMWRTRSFYMPSQEEWNILFGELEKRTRTESIFFHVQKDETELKEMAEIAGFNEFKQWLLAHPNAIYGMPPSQTSSNNSHSAISAPKSGIALFMDAIMGTKDEIKLKRTFDISPPIGTIANASLTASSSGWPTVCMTIATLDYYSKLRPSSSAPAPSDSGYINNQAKGGRIHPYYNDIRRNTANHNNRGSAIASTTTTTAAAAAHNAAIAKIDTQAMRIQIHTFETSNSAYFVFFYNGQTIYYKNPGITTIGANFVTAQDILRWFNVNISQITTLPAN